MPGRQGRAIKVTFNPGHNGKRAYTWRSDSNDTRIDGNTSIRNGNKLK